MWPTPIKSALQLLFYKVFAKKHGWGTSDTLYPLYRSRTWGWGILGWYPLRTFLSSRTNFLLNFIKICPGVWISIENIHLHSPPCPPGGLKSKTKKMLLLKFYFREILFYKYCTILKKIYPPPGPPLTPATLDLSPKSKIHSHHFVCLVKCFPKWYDIIW